MVRTAWASGGQGRRFLYQRRPFAFKILGAEPRHMVLDALARRGVSKIS
jgi:hypothetical protein